jgi:uncharacterized membrane protein YgcG
LGVCRYLLLAEFLRTHLFQLIIFLNPKAKQMRNQNKQRYLIRYLSIFTILVSIVIVKTSCTKLDVTNTSTQLHPPNFAEQFFATKNTPTPQIAKAIQTLKEQNNQTNFVNQLPANCGLPVWDKVRITKELYSNGNSLGSDTLETIVVPLTQNNDNLSSLVVSKEQTNGTYITKNYTSYNDLYTAIFSIPRDTVKAKNYLALFISMENQTFGTTTFYNIPAWLINDGMPADSNGNRTITGVQVNPNNLYSSEICIELCCPVCNGGDPNCPNGGCHWLCWEYDDDPGGGTGGTGGGGGTGGTGGTGGGGGTTCTTCNPPPPPNCDDPFYLVNPCGPPPPPMPTVVTTLKTILNLTVAQTNWLINDTPSLARANEMNNYLEEETNFVRKNAVIEHLNKMMNIRICNLYEIMP